MLLCLSEVLSDECPAGQFSLGFVVGGVVGPQAPVLGRRSSESKVRRNPVAKAYATQPELIYGRSVRRKVCLPQGQAKINQRAP
ncbi:hypothetical protein SAMN04515668_3866 [Hymenobacter arizonensis]|uniref:Uncharacterized protein n=1 Tax=Hymenobacter arizonensis TaxID=1227077 RepID=A0A1I6ASV5_HYMAR|nr:hypothetical protein SAMN04515668_3866 [Hymenobacter arizonensis]